MKCAIIQLYRVSCEWEWAQPEDERFLVRPVLGLINWLSADFVTLTKDSTASVIQSVLCTPINQAFISESVWDLCVTLKRCFFSASLLMKLHIPRKDWHLLMERRWHVTCASQPKVVTYIYILNKRLKYFDTNLIQITGKKKPFWNISFKFYFMLIP